MHNYLYIRICVYVSLVMNKYVHYVNIQLIDAMLDMYYRLHNLNCILLRVQLLETLIISTQTHLMQYVHDILPTLGVRS